MGCSSGLRGNDCQEYNPFGGRWKSRLGMCCELEVWASYSGLNIGLSCWIVEDHEVENVAFQGFI